MNKNEINIPVNLPGAKEAETDIQKLTKAIEALTEQTQKNAQINSSFDASTGRAGGNVDNMVGSVGKLAAGMWVVHKAIQAVTGAIQVQSQALQENARIAESQQNKLLSLQYIGEFYKERPELRSEVQALSEYGRRPFEEVASAYYNLRSNAGNLSTEQQSAIMREALEMGRTDPAQPLGNLINMFTLYAKLTGSTDMNRVQNVLQKTIEQAGGTGADVANYMPQFLPIGLAGGMSGAEAAGLWAYATTQTASPAEATTGLRATFMGLQGKGTPEAARLLKQFGVSGDMPFGQKIQVLSEAYRTGGLDLAAAERIVGREGASIFLSMLQNPAAMTGTIGSITGADRGDVDLTGGMIQGLLGSDPVARSEENIRLLRVSIANQRARDLNALKIQEIRLRQEYIARQRGVTEAGISVADEILNKAGAVGVSPDTMESLVGYDAVREQQFRDAGILPKEYNSRLSVTGIPNDNVNSTPSGDTTITYNNYNNSYFNQEPEKASERSGGGVY